jgi:hypothetical protein
MEELLPRQGGLSIPSAVDLAFCSIEIAGALVGL